MRLIMGFIFLGGGMEFGTRKFLSRVEGFTDCVG